MLNTNEILGQMCDTADSVASDIGAWAERLACDVNALTSEGIVGDARRQGAEFLSGIVDWGNRRDRTPEEWEADAKQEVGLQYRLFLIEQALGTILTRLSEVARGMIGHQSWMTELQGISFGYWCCLQLISRMALSRAVLSEEEEQGLRNQVMLFCEASMARLSRISQRFEYGADDVRAIQRWEQSFEEIRAAVADSDNDLGSFVIDSPHGYYDINDTAVDTHGRVISWHAKDGDEVSRPRSLNEAGDFWQAVARMHILVWLWDSAWGLADADYTEIGREAMAEGASERCDSLRDLPNLSSAFGRAMAGVEKVLCDVLAGSPEIPDEHMAEIRMAYESVTSLVSKIADYEVTEHGDESYAELREELAESPTWEKLYSEQTA